MPFVFPQKNRPSGLCARDGLGCFSNWILGGVFAISVFAFCARVVRGFRNKMRYLPLSRRA